MYTERVGCKKKKSIIQRNCILFTNLYQKGKLVHQIIDFVLEILTARRKKKKKSFGTFILFLAVTFTPK